MGRLQRAKRIWYIDVDGDIYESITLNQYDLNKISNIGNCFKTKEEAEKAVEKLKAWKRLKEKGFRFEGRSKPNYGEKFIIGCSLPEETLVIDVLEDMDLLFGGKE